MATLSKRMPGDDYATSTNALVIADWPASARDAAEALELAGVRAGAAVRFDDADEALGERPGVDLILIETMGVADALLDRVLARADAVARERGTGLVVALEQRQIDAVSAQVFGRHCQLLCAPDIAERVAAITVARAQAAGRGAQRVRIDDVTRDGEDARVQRLHEEIARFAETLTRLERGEEGERPGGVREAAMSFGGERDVDPAAVTAAEVRATIRGRRLRAQFFQGDLFADPAWDMLLDLFAADLEGQQVSVSSLCIAAAVPPTTALRWIGTLHDAGLFERKADPADRRRAYIVLSAKGQNAMRAYVAEIKRLGLALA